MWHTKKLSTTPSPQASHFFKKYFRLGNLYMTKQARKLSRNNQTVVGWLCDKNLPLNCQCYINMPLFAGIRQVSKNNLQAEGRRKKILKLHSTGIIHFFRLSNLRHKLIGWVWYRLWSQVLPCHTHMQARTQPYNHLVTMSCTQAYNLLLCLEQQTEVKLTRATGLTCDPSLGVWAASCSHTVTTAQV